MTKSFRMMNGEKFYQYNYNGFCLTKDRAEKTKKGLIKSYDRAKILYNARIKKYGVSVKSKMNLNTFKFKIRTLKNSRGKYAVYTNIYTPILITYTNNLNDERFNLLLLQYEK